MSETHFLFDMTNGVATITLNRPEAMNALAGNMRDVLLEKLTAYAEDLDVRCVVITGAGRAFCAGGDIEAMGQWQENNDTSGFTNLLGTVEKVVKKLRTMPQPVIAAINGPAAGGGMNMALACDMRLGCEKTLFSESFVKIGLVPDWGGFESLTRLVGAAKSMELMMTGERVKADEAYRLGLLNHVFSSDGFMDNVQAFAERLASGPPQAIAAIKRGVYNAVGASLDTVLDFEQRTQATLILSDDAREGVRAFLEKRPPKFGA